MKFTNNSILSNHYINYLKMLELNNMNPKLISTSLTNTEITEITEL